MRFILFQASLMLFFVGSSWATLTVYTFEDGSTISTADPHLTAESRSFRNDVTAVAIGSGVTYIGDYAFYNLSLNGITIPDSVTSIGNYAFADTGLSSVTIPNSVQTIGDHAFAGTGLSSVTIPNSVTRIGVRAFASLIYVMPGNISFSSQEGVLYNNGKTAILSYPRGNSGDGSGNFTIPNSVTRIGDYAFAGCSSLSSVTIPDSVTSIGKNAFDGCGALSNITIPNSVMTIGDDAFINCPGLTSFAMPDRFLGEFARFGVSGQAAADFFINALANNDAFVTAVANKILAASNNYGLATKTEVGGAVTMGVQQVLSAPSDYNLFTTQQVQDERTAGQNDVLNTPNSFSLYTTNQIHNLGLGGIVLDRNANNQLVLNYQIQQSSDLQNWSPYQQTELVISNAPSDKMFLRVQAVGQ